MSTGLVIFIAYVIGALLTLIATAIGIAYANGRRTENLSQKDIDRRCTALIVGTIIWPLTAIVCICYVATTIDEE